MDASDVIRDLEIRLQDVKKVTYVDDGKSVKVHFYKTGGWAARLPLFFMNLAREVARGGKIESCLYPRATRMGIVHGDICVDHDTYYYVFEAQRIALPEKAQHLLSELHWLYAKQVTYSELDFDDYGFIGSRDLETVAVAA
jgi:hypothetical protein